MGKLEILWRILLNFDSKRRTREMFQLCLHNSKSSSCFPPNDGGYFNNLFIFLFIYLCIYLLIYLFIYLFIHFFIYFFYVLIYLFIYSFVYPLIFSFIHLLNLVQFVSGSLSTALTVWWSTLGKLKRIVHQFRKL